MSARIEREIVIYQHIGRVGYRTMPWAFAENNGFSIHDYQKVYNLVGSFLGGSATRIIDIPDRVYAQFNYWIPADFEGHPLSISDIVAMRKKNETNWHYYYCDSFECNVVPKSGWVDITKLVRKQMKENV